MVKRSSLLGTGDSSEGGRNRTTKFSYHRVTLSRCLDLSVLNLVFCLSGYFIWYRNGWSDEKLVTLVDLAVRTVAWGAVCVNLHRCFPGSSESNLKLPVLLRVWWDFFLSISCYCLVVDFLLYEKYLVSLPMRSFLSDGLSVLLGLFFCYVGFLGKFEGGDSYSDAHLREPLIDGTSNSNGSTRNYEGSETVTPYSKAGIFGKFTFSWMSPLIAFGNKKTLDLKDVPLVKALISFAWKEILITALCALIYAVASCMGPYLIDTHVQYLSGQRAFENEGYFLVSAFLTGKLVECISRRQWFFRLEQVGIRACAVIVAMIYEKGLNLSCHSSRAHTSGKIINFVSVDAERVGDFVWLRKIKPSVWHTKVSGIVRLCGTKAYAAQSPWIQSGKIEENILFGKEMDQERDERVPEACCLKEDLEILSFCAWLATQQLGISFRFV
ncbi:hypothetical protein CRG98_009085 [Punica granatum]|uniref:ABC transmembrane type-1 domain-containing protein n=1 Tax=Punica granatum TaxID=22663 RepID=A0A2I0KQH7_PUNGR|nr:hypothetical protein CRG98_009085 [Punica granatum]